MSEQPVAWHDLPAAQFPFTVLFLRGDTEEVVHRIEVTGPGAVEVPPLGAQLGVAITVQIVKERT